MKLGLGTVQFGCDYGISNKSGQVDIDEVSKILEFAKSKNIDTLDTAQGYGNSEKVLGKLTKSGQLSDFKIITKLMGESHLETSLEDLNQSEVYGLMFHRANEVNDKTWKQFEDYKSQNLVKKIGVSVYLPKELEEIIAKYPIDIVQFPMNLLDQRFLPLIPKLKAKNIEIHTRSTFLQGLLLMNTKEINPYFDKIKPTLEKIPTPRLENTLGFASSISGVDKIIVGTTSSLELKQITKAIEQNCVPKNPNSFIIEEEAFVLPQNWKVQ